ncbi:MULTISPECIES: helix-turn-helix domain-containing protein [unclassified Streptomyces]|uniref:helix-turn-helix domain-containing protein n=1 Tax=unclassified Streptomyces TaxID=2593676 RepID=UPI001EF0D2E4|nr:MULTISPECIES: helix-turn-helix domain-containing protein [unclassified Streptomyces]
MTDTTRHPSDAPSPDERSVVLDAKGLRTMAHPVRVRLVGLLRKHGPSTATRLAERLGVNSGTAGYHLRQLDAAGFVEEDTERGNARERWWRSVHRTTWFNDPELAEREPEAALAYQQSVASLHALRTRQTLNELQTMPRVWREKVRPGRPGAAAHARGSHRTPAGAGGPHRSLPARHPGEPGDGPGGGGARRPHHPHPARAEHARPGSGDTVTREGPDLPGERSLRPPAGVLAAVAASVTGTRISLISLPWFVLGSVLVAVVLPRGTGRPAVAPAAPHDAREPGYWRRFGEGFALLRGDPLLLAVIVVVGITNLLDAALSTLMIPVRAGESGRGPAATGLVSTVMGAAAAGGSLIAAMAAHRLPRRAVFLTTTLAGLRPEWRAMDRSREDGVPREAATSVPRDETPGGGSPPSARPAGAPCRPSGAG